MIQRQHLSLINIILILSFSACSNTISDSTGNFKQSFKNAAKYLVKNVFSDSSELKKHMEKVVNAASEVDCKYKCPDGNIPRSNPSYKPKANGCGVAGLKIKIPKNIPASNIENCCDEHDICYGTCNKNKEKCDEKFKKCMYKVCSSLKNVVSEDVLKGCKGIAKTLNTGVTMMGCKYYLEAQKDACICKRDEL